MEFFLSANESGSGTILWLLKLDFLWGLCIKHGEGKDMNLQFEALSGSCYYTEQIAILLVTVSRDIFFIQHLVLGY